MQIKPVKTAVVGCGIISQVYLRNMTRLFSILDVVAVCDLVPELAQEAARKYGVPRVMTLEEITADPEIELVINLTAASAHYGVIRQLLLAGKHVYTEKTMTARLEQARELVDIANAKGLYLAVAPDTALGAAIQTARWAVDHGLIGEVTSCVVSINRDQNLNAERFRFLRSEGGCLPYDVGIYYIQALLCILGPVAEVTGFGAPARPRQRQFLYNKEDAESWQIPGNNLVAGSLKFRRGTLGMLHFDGNTIGAECSTFRIYGTEGILELGDPNRFGDPVTLIKPESPPCQLPMTHGYDGTCVLEDATDFEKGYGNRGIGVAELAWAIRKGRPNRLNKEMGLHGLEVLCGLDETARTGGVYHMTSTFTSEPVKPGIYSTMWGGGARADAELSLVD
ncbi:MAG: Gfo/Idh/MocA family oxidoreductase [Clostridiales bacterium]|nr:Gfo/Idh/MocA family oxidoreductase [Clostridiales bacterium]